MAVSLPAAAETPAPRKVPRALRKRVDEAAARAWTLRLTDAVASVALADQAFTEADSVGYAVGAARARLVAGVSRMLQRDDEAARVLLEDAESRFLALGDDAGRASALNGLGTLLGHRADYPAALTRHLEALRLQRACRHEWGQSESLLQLGNVYFQVGEYARALQHYQAAQALKETLRDAPGLAHCAAGVGSAHGRLADFRAALDHHQQALRLKREQGDRTGTAAALVDVGTAHAGLGDDERARESFDAALEMSRATGERRVEADVLRELGALHRRRGEASLALTRYEEGLEAAQAAGAPQTEAELHVAAGEAHVEGGNPTRGIEHLRRALEIGEATGSERIRMEAHRALAAAHEAAGDASAALRHFKTFHELEDAVFGHEADQRVRSILTQVELERSHHETDVLRHKNDALEAANAALAAANAEKARLLEAVQTQAAALERLTHEDELTGLSNRRHLDTRLGLEWERALRFGRPLSVAMADVDLFKQVNDTFSHAVGDRVLREIGRILSGGVRAIDVAARYGGEEFALVLVETSTHRAGRVCERLRAEVAAFDWEGVAPGLRVTLSIGLAGIDEASDAPDQLLAGADKRLYAAKSAGRNRVVRP